MKTPFNYLNKQFAPNNPLHQLILASISNVMTRGDFTLGREVSEFEAAWADATGAEFAVGMSSGTDAIALTLLACAGNGESSIDGARVLVPAFSFPASAQAIIQAGGVPVFADIDDALLLDARATTEDYDLMLPVDWAGAVWDGDSNVPIIKDACQSIGASQPWNVWVSCYSLHPLKNINTICDGGMVTTGDPEIYERLLKLRNHGFEGRDDWVTYGVNARLSTIAAAAALPILETLEEETLRRQHNARIYDDSFADVDQIVIPRRPEQHVYHVYQILCQDRNNLIEYLGSVGVEARVHYRTPLHLQPAVEYLGYMLGDFPIAEAAADSVVTLPIHPWLEEDQVVYAAGQVREFYA